MNFFKKLTVVNRGLRYKLLIAFSLMSIIPLLACMYVISAYLFPELESLPTISIVIVVSILISILGLFLARSLIDPVIDMAIEAKLIAGGEYNRKIVAPFEDEVGHLAESINFMTHKIKTNMDELKGYGRKIGEVNQEIQKKMLALSSLLQIGDIISQGSSQLDTLLDLALEKACSIFDAGFGALYMPQEEGGDVILRTSCNIEKENLDDIVIKNSGNGILEKIIAERSIVIIDKSAKLSKELAGFRLSANVENFIIIPLYSNKRNLGLLILGSRLSDFKYKSDDIEIIRVFSKQMAIAIESDILSKKTSELSITDDLTNLYNKRFILGRLEEEIKRSVFYQRPCSFIVFSMEGFDGFRNKYGELASEEALRRIARSIKDNMVPVGKAARVSGFEFAVLLPEKNKKEASQIAEDIRKMVESTNLLREGNASLKIVAGVSENPIDGATGEELFKKAMEAAKGIGRNNVIS